ncbi:MAG: UDP-N-acetylmuramyl-tripeptide synthetase [Patescibacteria group bacterium]
MLEKVLRFAERLIPKKLYRFGQPAYHSFLALAGALLYRFPSRKLKVIAVTGTKGKSTTTEFVNAILEAAGEKTALLNTIRFKVADTSRPNKFKMTVPGRFFVQKFLRGAIHAGCTWVVLEMSSEAVRQFRHMWIALDGLIFTNLAPEHIESHGSFEKYRDAKLKIARAVARSSKKNTVIVANADDPSGELFLNVLATRTLSYRLSDASPYETRADGSTFTFHGHGMSLHIPGEFNIMNALGAATFAESQNIPLQKIHAGLSNVTEVRGRVEYVREGQSFDVIVDYAHTPESLEALYKAFPNVHKIGLLGNTGGGRDTWKRPVMAGIAEKYCDEIILTNEDPYDEDPKAILDEMRAGMKDKNTLTVIFDRRAAIHEALLRAKRSPDKALVLITGKGTDPYIMGPRGSKTPWDDATVVREELKKINI